VGGIAYWPDYGHICQNCHDRENKPSAQQLSTIFGLSTFHATTQMQIGNVLETKRLQGYCKQNKMNLKKERGGISLTLLYQYNYVGHTPDGKTIQSKGDDAGL
jgi:hypothetical protein